MSSQYVNTAYSYDSAGRLEYETLTRESGGTTNLYRTNYAYAWIAAGSGGGHTLTRTEQTWDTQGSVWANSFRTQYSWDSLGRQYYEERQDWVSNAWSNRFDITQPRIVSGGERLRLKPSGRPSSACVRRSLNKNGSRTGYDKNVAGGYNSDYGKAYNLSYAFNSVNALNAIVDLDDVSYGCTVTCDANGNITQVDESQAGVKPTPQTNYLYSYFTYDALNRLTEHKTKAYVAGGTNAWVLTRRTHAYDALGRLTQSGYRSYNEGGADPGPTNHSHAYSGSRLVQNVSSDGASFGARWHWARAANEHWAPLKSPNPDTASQSGYNYAVGGSDVAGGGGAGGASPMRRSFVNPTTEGDQRHVFGQGRPMAKDASGSGANWYQGTLSAAQNANQNIVESRLFFTGTTGMSGGLDLSRSTDAREKERIGIFGTGFSYAGSYGRVTSESIGRDLNPLGRGDGEGYVAGALDVGGLVPGLPFSEALSGTGNSVNNQCGTGTSSLSLHMPRGDSRVPNPRGPDGWLGWPPHLPLPQPPRRPQPLTTPPPPEPPPAPQPPGPMAGCEDLAAYGLARVVYQLQVDHGRCNRLLAYGQYVAMLRALNPEETTVTYRYAYPPFKDAKPCLEEGTYAYTLRPQTPDPHKLPLTKPVKAATVVCCDYLLVLQTACDWADTMGHELIHAGDETGQYNDVGHDMQDFDKFKNWMACWCRY